MKRCMIMLTSEYPFSVEETFLESEIDFHKDSFDRIIILAIDLQKNAEKTRAVPDNTDCYNVTPIDKKLGRNIDKAVGALRIIAPSKYYKFDKAIIKSDIKKRIFFEYFCQRAEREYKYCADILKKYDFSEYDEIIIYSYWLFVTSLIGIKLKNNLEKSCKKIRLISRAHGYDLCEERNPFNYLPLRKYILENIDRVFVCSDFGVKHLADMFPEYKNKIKNSFLGTFDHGIEEYSKSDCINIVSCSHLAEVKRVDRIVSSLALVKNAKFHWTHIGGGELFDNVKKFAEEKLSNGSFEFK
ncbi:MAG: hypothetical protein KBT46_04145, partial [Ruminococcus sp.]|nr:hypothetical protein [Candidatus Copronaster equi]